MITDFVNQLTRMLHAHAHCKSLCLHLDAVTLKHFVNVLRAVTRGKNYGVGVDFVAFGSNYRHNPAALDAHVVHPRGKPHLAAATEYRLTHCSNNPWQLVGADMRTRII